jgi:hypothetical protein
MRVEYRFAGPLGPAEGSDATTTPPAAGARIWVLHDEAHPERSMMA